MNSLHSVFYQSEMQNEGEVQINCQSDKFYIYEEFILMNVFEELKKL